MKRIFFFYIILLLLTSCGPSPFERSSEKSNENQIKQEIKCNVSSGPICAQPPMPECPPGQMCVQVMPNIKTFNNECEMINANATKVQLGVCPGGQL